MVEVAVTPLTDREKFLADWSSLYGETPDAGFFQSPDWMNSWLAGAPAEAELFKVEVTEDGRVALMGVLAASGRNYMGLGPREIWFQEFGDPKRDSIYPEYLDFLTPREGAAPLRIKAAGAIMDYFASADSFVFRNARMRMMSAVLCAAAGRGYPAHILREQPVYVCPLDEDELGSGLSKSLRTKIRRSMELYNERGPLTGALAETPEEKRAAYEKLKTLHETRWRGKGQEGVFANRHFNAFHDRLWESAPQNLHLFEVRAGDQTIAVLYNFVHGKRAMNYQSGFHIEDDNRVTPGFVAHALAAQFYQENGFETYDLLAGEEEYKARLGEPETILTSFVVERPTWRNKVRALIKA